MKIQIMKLFLTSALSLAITASFMGNPATAQAAGDKGASPLWVCDHYWYQVESSWSEYEASNSEYHYIYEDGLFKCSICAEYSVQRIRQIGYEKHDLIAADWPHRFRCSLCEFEE